MQSPLPITNTCVNILETQFALHINLQYKLSRRWRSIGPGPTRAADENVTSVGQ